LKLKVNTRHDRSPPIPPLCNKLYYRRTKFLADARFVMVQALAEAPVPISNSVEIGKDLPPKSIWALHLTCAEGRRSLAFKVSRD
jgi:hypothetical protein